MFPFLKCYRIREKKSIKQKNPKKNIGKQRRILRVQSLIIVIREEQEGVSASEGRKKLNEALTPSYENVGK